MKIDFDAKVVNLAGIPITIDDEEATLGKVLVAALLVEYRDEILTGQEKAARYLLAKRIYDGTADLTLADIECIKTLIGKAYGPVIVGPAYALLEGQHEA